MPSRAESRNRYFRLGSADERAQQRIQGILSECLKCFSIWRIRPAALRLLGRGVLEMFVAFLMIGRKYALRGPSAGDQRTFAQSEQAPSVPLRRDLLLHVQYLKLQSIPQHDRVQVDRIVWYPVVHAWIVCSTSRLVLNEVESNLSSRAGNGYGANSEFAAIQSLRRSFRSCAVIPYGSSGAA
ncbi:hypothetical protein MRB53_039954 [Persea americana]|nr:hypothetical protein MRB53_039954 [Persea americana]